jgi:hypothetical protein
MLSTDPPVDRRDGDVAPKRFDRRDAHLRGDARSLETATADSPYWRNVAASTDAVRTAAPSAANNDHDLR